jgi:uncharacterized membrane protein YdbT with pleckstrin-like domain
LRGARKIMARAYPAACKFSGFAFQQRQGGDYKMMLHMSMQPVLAIIAGILILVMPRLLNYIVAIFLILYGILGLIQ